MTAVTTQGFASEHRSGLVVAVVGHVLMLAALSTSLVLLPKVPATRLAIEAVIVDESVIKRAADADRRKTEQAAQRRREESVRQQRQDKDRKAADQRRKQEQAEAARQRQVQQRKETEAAAAAEQQRKQAEADARARAEQERVAAEARAEQERIAAAARAAAEAERREQQRRQAELIASMAVEEELMAARDSGEMGEYLALIQQRVERKWVPPPSARDGLECEVVVKQLPDGTVNEARVVSCNGDEAVRRSVERAVQSSSPLPLPANRALFDRNLRFIFKPEQ